jgi:hypothetical protein
MKTRNEQVGFLSRNGESIAAFAQSEYQAHGRGMVCVLSDYYNLESGQVPITFATLAQAPEIIEDWNGSKEKRLVSSYDPEKEFVVMFIRTVNKRKTDYDAYRLAIVSRPFVGRN